MGFSCVKPWSRDAWVFVANVIYTHEIRAWICSKAHWKALWSSDHQSFTDSLLIMLRSFQIWMDRAWQRQIETASTSRWIQMIKKALQSMTVELSLHLSFTVWCWNIIFIFGPSTVTIWKLLKHKFDMWWKHPESRPIQSQRSDVVKNLFFLCSCDEVCNIKTSLNLFLLMNRLSAHDTSDWRVGCDEMVKTRSSNQLLTTVSLQWMLFVMMVDWW